MNITKHNCESFFLDYYEKNLSPVEVAEVLFFLEENPEFKEVFESYEAIFLEDEKIKFTNKEAIKMPGKEQLDTILASEIDKTNCEQFFVASAEGILSGPQIQKLNSFLTANPELQRDFDLIQKCKLSAEKISFEHKELLKKETVNAQNSEEFFIRSIEKDLNASEQKQLTSFLQKNPGYLKEFELFKQTILVPEKITFQFKSALKKKERKPVFVTLRNVIPSGVEGVVEGYFQQRTYYAAAAAILLLAGLFFFFRSDDSNASFLANTKSINVKPEKSNIAPVKQDQVVIPLENPTNIINEQAPVKTNISVNKNSIIPAPSKIEENIVEPVQPESKMEDPLMAKKEEEKKIEEVPIETPLVAIHTPEKKDSLPAEASAQAGAAFASAVNLTSKEDEYQTIAAVVNKKVRSALGIKKSTECESSDKINLWDLAMAAKKGVQKVIGTKTLDIQKVCDGTGENVEYVFTAGNFGISKSSGKLKNRVGRL